MKRNRTTVRVAHMKNRGGKSRYAAKVAAGKQMYGPGCCAHATRIRVVTPSNNMVEL